MKLKTLKDLAIDDKKAEIEIQGMVDAEELRQEAIKWIKDFYGSGENWRDIHQPRLRDWMHFFNITEEDLNDE